MCFGKCGPTKKYSIFSSGYRVRLSTQTRIFFLRPIRGIYHTLPEDFMPFQMHAYTMVQAKMRHRSIFHLIPSGLSMPGLTSNALRYQKYDVDPAFVHSSISTSCVTLPWTTVSVGHEAQGRGY